MSPSAWRALRALTNDEAGIATLLEDLSARSCELVVLEATGGFEDAVTTAMAAAGLPVVSSILARRATSLTRPGALTMLDFEDSF